MADLGLSDREGSRVLAEADVNDDGVIDYAEFRHALSSARRKSGDRLAPPVS